MTQPQPQPRPISLNSLEDIQKALQILGDRDSSEKSHKNLLDYCQHLAPQYMRPKHIKYLAEKLEAVERGEIKRLAISMPPRHGKSELASNYFPSWFLGRNPNKYVIFSTYAQELADDFGRKVRNTLRDDRYGMVFPDVKLDDTSQSARRFGTNRGGAYFAVGAGGAITGRGAHLLIIDDIIKGREDADSMAIRRSVIDWYKSTAYTRLMPGAAVVIIGTRWHEDDLIGHVLENAEHESWEVVSLPAIAEEGDTLLREPGEALWPKQYPVERLLEIKQTVGSREWAALFQQSPSAEEGNIFKRTWWRLWKDIEPPECDYLIQSYDTAFSSSKQADFTAIQTWGVFSHDNKPNAILLSCLNERLEYPELRDRAKELYKKWRPDMVLIEKKASGQSLLQDLRRTGIPVTDYMPDRDKVSRAHSVAPMVESGQIWLPQNKFWAEDFLNQCSGFPNARRKDMVDAFTQAIIRLKSGYFLHYGEPEEDDLTTSRKKRYYW